VNQNPENRVQVDAEEHDEAAEARWVALARQGDSAGWAALHRLYYRGLWGAVNQIVLDEKLAEDVVQEAFIKAYRKIRRFRGDARFSTWIYRIAINQAYDTLRKRSRREKWLGLFPLSQDEEESPKEYIVEETSATAAFRGDQQEAISRALQTLSPEHRAVVELRLIQGFSTEETARILKVKKGTVLSRLFYSCQKMKKLLKKTYEEL
jgi:RNA polymerase sigma-70 factor (ECF subfamily)